VLDALARAQGAVWHTGRGMDSTEIMLSGNKVLLIKPQTYMNDSGAVIPALAKKGIKAGDILVVHDELEKPFGHVSIKVGGSAKGHNGLRSIIQHCGPDFARLRVGIGRPSSKEDVSSYVLSQFSESDDLVDQLIHDAVKAIEETCV
jgi:PTH1 family peptidyl-tRNA hydrolase